MQIKNQETEQPQWEELYRNLTRKYPKLSMCFVESTKHTLYRFAETDLRRDYHMRRVPLADIGINTEEGPVFAIIDTALKFNDVS